MPLTYLAFDYGSKRTGLAVGNDLLCTSQALPAIHTRQFIQTDGKLVLNTLQKIVVSWKINHLVFGLPLDAKSRDTLMSKQIKHIAQQLGQALALPISFADERYSSNEADRIIRQQQRPGKKLSVKKIALRDSIAAQLILDAYFQSGTTKN